MTAQEKLNHFVSNKMQVGHTSSFEFGMTEEAYYKMFAVANDIMQRVGDSNMFHLDILAKQCLKASVYWEFIHLFKGACKEAGVTL